MFISSRRRQRVAIHEHYTDMSGSTDLIFRLFEILGYRFAPRLRDLPDQVLYRATKAKIR